MSDNDNKTKPAKPYADFPLYAHRNGQWAKRIRGRIHYFGTWHDPQGALDDYLARRDDLLAGRTTPRDASRATLHDLCNLFMASRERLRDAGELAPVTYRDYHVVCRRLLEVAGRTTIAERMAPADFERVRAKLSKRLGPTSLANYVVRIRTIFRYGHQVGLLRKLPEFGPGFHKPPERVLRQVRLDRGPQMFEAGEIRRLLAAAPPVLRAMILLGINCGWGNGDCASVPRTAFADGWVRFPRPKTANPRRCPLWPETVEALELALPMRPAPHDPADAGLAFLTGTGRPWARTGDRPLSQRFRKLLAAVGLDGRGLGFYCLRRTFATIASDTADQVAVDAIMGHVPETRDMTARYRQRITDERLVAVTDHVRAWVFPVPRVLAPSPPSPPLGD